MALASPTAAPRILVIRRDNIGDLVCATPLLAALRARYPQAHIATLVNSYNAGVLSGNPDVDAVHAYTKLKHRAAGEPWLGTLFGKARLLRSLREPPFDHAILAKSAFDGNGLELARRVRPRRIIGFAAPDERAAKALTDRLPLPANAELHEAEVMMQLGAPLGVEGPPGPARVYPPRERVARWRERLASGKSRWLAVHISARQANRIWPVERFAELIRELGRAADAGIVLLWSPGAEDDRRHPGDDARAAAIATRVGASTTLLPAKTESLEDLIAILSLCQGFIGPDGGAMHVAAALGLPVVAFFENLPDKMRHWHPWRVPYELVCPRDRDVADISVSEVAGAWARLAARLP